MKNVVVTGADRGLGLSLCKVFLQEGYRVFAGRYMPEWPELDRLIEEFPQELHIMPLDVSSGESVVSAARFVGNITGCVDILINNAGISGMQGSLREGYDYSRMLQVFDVNTLGPIRMVEAFLPLMKEGMKRLCFVSSEAGSVAVCSRVEGHGYTMTKTALNMAIRHMHNQLYKEGFTFRIYHPGWLRSYMSGKKNLNATVEPDDSAKAAFAQFVEGRPWEDCLVMLDNEGAAWPF